MAKKKAAKRELVLRLTVERHDLTAGQVGRMLLQAMQDDRLVQEMRIVPKFVGADYDEAQA